jgi:hypothetical protein
LALTNLDTLILTTDFYVWYGAHGGCDRLAGDFRKITFRFSLYHHEGERNET